MIAATITLDGLVCAGAYLLALAAGWTILTRRGTHASSAASAASQTRPDPRPASASEVISTGAAALATPAAFLLVASATSSAPGSVAVLAALILALFIMLAAGENAAPPRRRSSSGQTRDAGNGSNDAPVSASATEPHRAVASGEAASDRIASPGRGEP